MNKFQGDIFLNELGRNGQKKAENNKIFTKETLGVVFILFATLCLVCLITREKVFSYPGQVINAFFLGCFGYFSYLLFGWFIYFGIALLFDKKSGIKVFDKILIVLDVVLLAVFLQTVTLGGKFDSFWLYISNAYKMGAGGIATSSAGGFFTSLLSYPLINLLTVAGSAVVEGILIAVISYYLGKKVYFAIKKKKESGKLRSTFVKEEVNDNGIEILGTMDYPIDAPQLSESKPRQSLFVANPDEFAFKSKKELAKGDEQNIKIGFTENGLGVATYTQKPTETPMLDDYKKKIEYIKQPSYINVEKTVSGALYEGSTAVDPNRNERATTVSGYVSPSSLTPTEKEEIPYFEHEESSNIGDDYDAKISAERFSEKYVFDEVGDDEVVLPPVSETEDAFRRVEETTGEVSEYVDFPDMVESTDEMDPPIIEENGDEEETIVPPSRILDRRSRNIFGDLDSKENALENTANDVNYQSMAEKDGNFFTERSTPLSNSRRLNFDSEVNNVEEKKEEVQMEIEIPEEEVRFLPKDYKYNRPPLDLLERRETHIDTNSENHEERMEIIKETLSQFKIEAEPQGFVQGPTITRYEIMMPPRVSVKTVLRYDDDLKMRLASKYGVRIEAPIPGKNLVGIEVANKTKVTVGLREVIEGYAGQPSKPYSLMFALGKDIVGDSKTDNLAKGPHYLVAGATGSGKSVALNVMIVSLLMRYSPEELRFILVDPKSVGFRLYEHMPHLLIDEIITEAPKTIAVLQWAYEEMERRYKLFTECEMVCMDLEGYNTQIEKTDKEKLPRIVIVIDELADLMETCKKDMETGIRMLAAKARAAGIHLVLATQRPSVDVITGTIKANLPSRIALKVMNFADSSTILGEGGAEKLLGNGDMLFKNSSMSETERYQGAWVSEVEIANIVSYLKEKNQSYFHQGLNDFLKKTNTTPNGYGSSKKEEISATDDEGGDADETLFVKALWTSVNAGFVSISSLQRRFKLGFSRAARLVDKMEELGYVSQNEGSKARRVILTKEEFIEKYGEPPTTR